MSGYFYKGRHRAATESRHTGRTLAAGATVAALALPGSVVLAPEAQAGPPGGWGPIIDCESGGRATVVNSIGAAGLFQFMPGTWRSVGGSGSAANASVAEQYRRAEMLYAREGLRPWTASRDCWRGKVGGPSQASLERARPAAAPAPRGGKHRAPAVTNGRAADGTGTYVCGPSTYFLAACDPGDEGEVKAYPLYAGHSGKHSSGIVKAASHKPGKHRAGPPADLGRRDAKGHGTYTCQPSHYGYAACGPENRGERVAFPAFD